MKALRRIHTASGSSSSNSKPSSSPHSSPSLSSWVHLRSVLFVVASSSSPASSSDRGDKSPCFRRRRKHVLSPHQWQSFFTPDGKLHDGGVTLLKKVRNGGIDPSIRPEVWPFLLGVYNLKSTKEERNIVDKKKRREYERLRRQCRQLLEQMDEDLKEKEMVVADSGKSTVDDNLMGVADSEKSTIDDNLMGVADSGNSTVDDNLSSEKESVENPIPSSPPDEDVASARESLSSEKESVESDSDNPSSALLNSPTSSTQVQSAAPSIIYADSSDSDLSEQEVIQTPPEEIKDRNPKDDPSLSKHDNNGTSFRRTEDFSNWKRIIRLDAVRANAEWVPYSPSQAAVSDEKARLTAEALGLKDYDHLEPCRIFHAARLVAILEAYSVYDSEIGYCQGMSDLLSPIIAVIEDDCLAFWCFVGFMKKARHNFRLDELGIRRQLNTVSKIIEIKDSHLYRHLVNLQAEDCFFVYRMVVVLFRRELDFEQTLCLWEVMWADQTAIRAGIRKPSWSKIRQRAPPTEDLLLYAIAASVLQKRKQIIEKYESMDEILRECNNMSGSLDVWKLLDDAHYLVITLHDKIETTPL